MPQKKHKPEEIVAKLRHVNLLVSQGQSVADTVYLNRAARQPAFNASVSSQNQRSPLTSEIFVRPYQGDQGV